MRLIDADKLKSAVERHEVVSSLLPLNDYDYGHNSGLESAVIEIEDAETVNAIPVDWIRTYISNLKAMGVQLSLRDAQAVSVMVDKYMMEQNGNATCGPDYCEIGGTHND